MFGQQKKRQRALRIFFATDIHGSDTCFRKFLAAAKVYQPNVLIMGGDYAGKGLVPVLETADGSLTARVDGEDVMMPAESFDELAKAVNRRGFYGVRMTLEDQERLAHDKAELDRLFHDQIAAQLRRWCLLAAERLDPDVRCIVTPGNDDPLDADAVLVESNRVECPELELCDLGPVTMASVGMVPRTPWDTERECTEDELGKHISGVLDALPEGRPCLFNVHCPPYASSLDDAPELDASLKPVIRGGRPSIVPVGSTAVREAIKRYQPVVGLHGHIHESRGVQKIGRTLCINPGSDYSSGVLRGAVVDLAEDGTCLDFLLTTG
jgi:Icc-related predicted phosphoesterase